MRQTTLRPERLGQPMLSGTESVFVSVITGINRTYIRQPDSGWRHERLELYEMATVVLLSSCLAGFLVNSVVLMVVACFARGRVSIVTRATLGLASADAFSALVLALGFLINAYLAKVLRTTVNSTCFVLVLEAFKLGIMITSAVHLLAISKIQHWAVTKPSFQIPTSVPILAAYVLTLWLLPCGTLLISFLTSSLQPSGECDLMFLRSFRMRIPISVVFLVTWGLMFALHYDTYRLLQRSEGQFVRRKRSLLSIRRKQRAQRTTIAILGSSLIAWIPATVQFVLTADSLRSDLFSPEALFYWGLCVNFLLVTKQILNPIIYALRIPEIQASFRAAKRRLLGIEANFDPEPQMSQSRSRSMTATAYSRPSVKDHYKIADDDFPSEEFL